MTSMKDDQRGLVSITVTVILMLVISITVLSFAQIIRREQREALDNQLSSQAYYAAESGVNDVRTFLNANTALLSSLPPKSTCGNDANYTLSPTVSSGVSYTCVLVNPTPKSLEYNLSTSAASKVVPIKPSQPLANLTFSWQSSQATNPLTGCPTSLPSTLKPADQWTCGYGIIRVDLVPVDGLMTRQGLQRNAFTAFLTPQNSSFAATTSYTQNGDGNTVNSSGQQKRASCVGASPTTPAGCSVTINSLPTTGNYYARVSTLYRDAKLTITGKTSGGSDVEFKEAQLLVDSTGKAQDVLRRIQVRVPLTSSGLHADNAITSNQSLCKNFESFRGEPRSITCN